MDMDSSVPSGNIVGIHNVVHESPKKCITDEIHTIFKIEDNLGLDDFKDDSQYY